MATDDQHRVLTNKPASTSTSKWLSTKGLRLSIHRRQSKPSSSATFRSLNSPMSPCTPKNITKEDELKQVFRYFDGDGDGKISALELRSFFGSVGEYMSFEEAQGVIDDLDSDGDSLLDFNDFTRMMMKGDHDKVRGNDDEDLKMAFEMFELEKKGCITPKGLQRMLSRLGDAKSYDECVAMIQVFDTDGDGVLDYYEFSQMMA